MKVKGSENWCITQAVVIGGALIVGTLAIGGGLGLALRALARAVI